MFLDRREDTESKKLVEGLTLDMKQSSSVTVGRQAECMLVGW